MLTRSASLVFLAVCHVLPGASAILRPTPHLHAEGNQRSDSHLRQTGSVTASLITKEAPPSGARNHVLHVLTPDKQAHPAVGRGGWIQLCCIALSSIIIGLVISHEIAVSFTGKVFWLNDNLLPDEKHTQYKHSTQTALLAYWVLLMMDTGMLIPTSYELAQEMGASASLSGTFIGCGYLSTPVGAISAAYLFKRCSLSTSRYIGLIGAFMLMSQNLVMALILDSSKDHSPATMWLLICVRIGLGVGRVAYVVQYMAYNLTARIERMRLSILVAMATNLGMCLGPYLTAVVIQLLGGRESVPSVFSRTSAIMYVMAALWASLALLFALCMPAELNSPMTPSSPPARVERLLKCTVDDRKSIVAHALHFCVNRALASSAIEAGSAMILETQFNWSTRAIGFSISAVFFVTVVLCGVTVWVHSKRWVKDVGCLMFLTCLALLGTLLYLDFHNGVAWQVLLADVLVYPSMFSANGIVDGIVTTLAIPDTWYSVESYLGAKSLQGIPRFVAFPLARYIIDCCGRNSYAALLMAFGVLGAVSAFTISWRAEWKDPATPGPEAPSNWPSKPVLTHEDDQSCDQSTVSGSEVDQSTVSGLSRRAA